MYDVFCLISTCLKDGVLFGSNIKLKREFIVKRKIIERKPQSVGCLLSEAVLIGRFDMLGGQGFAWKVSPAPLSKQATVTMALKLLASFS